MIRFYSPDIEQTGKLTADESGHCYRVLRLREGAEIYVVDGHGYVYRSRIIDADARGVSLDILEKHREEKNWKGHLILAVAPTKNADRMEWLLEKAVEMGIDEIVLLKCTHSERKVMRLDRLEKIMVSAMKQSLKATLPLLSGPISYDEFVEKYKDRDIKKVIGYCDDKTERLDLSKVYTGRGDLIIVIGPEGDFTTAEIEKARAAGFVPITFGKSRLRTETAALYGIAAFHTLKNLQEG